MKRWLSIIVFGFILCSPYNPTHLLWSHSGKIVKRGCLKDCHSDRSVGNYHCHGSSAIVTYPSEEMAREARCNTTNPPPNNPTPASNTNPTNPNSGTSSTSDTSRGIRCCPKYNYDPDDYTYTVRKQILNARGSAFTGWTDFYTGTVYRNSAVLHIDHVVSRKEAHDTGGYGWCSNVRETFADDLENIVITHQDVNLEKSSDGPEDWLTTTDQIIPDYRACEYLRKFVQVKVRYGLEISARQRTFLSHKERESGCWSVAEN